MRWALLRPRGAVMVSMRVAAVGLCVLWAVCGIGGILPQAAAAPLPDFYAFGLHGAYGSHSLSYTNPGAASATVTAIPCAGGAAVTTGVGAGSSVEPNLLIGVNSGSQVTSANLYGIHAPAPVGVGQLGQMSASADAADLIPLGQWGTHYHVLTYPADHTVFAVVAAEPVQVTVVPTVTTTAGGGLPSIAAGTTYVFNLNGCEAAQFVAIGDLSGTYVKGDVPIAVFSGTQCAFVPASSGPCDGLLEQTRPDDWFGPEYVLCRSPARDVEPDFVRVMAIWPSTTVTVGTTPYFLASAGDIVDLSTAGDVAITADNDVAVLQVLVSNGMTLLGLWGDPSITQVEPLKAMAGGGAGFAFHTYLALQFNQNFATLVVPPGASPTVDGVPVSPQAVAGSAYGCGRVASLAPGYHEVADAGGVQFGAYGKDVSYLAPAFRA